MTSLVPVLAGVHREQADWKLRLSPSRWQTWGQPGRETGSYRVQIQFCQPESSGAYTEEHHRRSQHWRRRHIWLSHIPVWLFCLGLRLSVWRSNHRPSLWLPTGYDHTGTGRRKPREHNSLACHGSSRSYWSHRTPGRTGFAGENKVHKEKRAPQALQVPQGHRVLKEDKVNRVHKV